MKDLKIVVLSFIAILFFVFTFSSCDDDSDASIVDRVTVLTQEEQDLLIYMREEEKLAHDVYTYFYDVYGLQIFTNISNSEQHHADKLLELIQRYELVDPALSEVGVFSNTELQKLYDDLIILGEQSLVDALKVGAMIEDVDIYDLENAITRTTQSDIIQAYEQLMCGSRNHTRGFTNQLKEHNETFVPTFISQQLYDEIILGEHESCGH